MEKKSIEKFLNNVEDGKKKVDLLIDAAKEIDKSNSKKSLELGEEAYKLADELEYEEGSAQSLLVICHALVRTSNYEKAMKYLYKAMPIFEKLKDKNGIAKIFSMMGINYFYFGRYEMALKYCIRSLKLVRKTEDRGLEASIINNIGEIYREQQKSEQALVQYINALKIIENLEEKECKAAIYFNIGLIYHSKGKDETALEYYNKSLKISREIEDPIREAERLNKIGEVHESLQQDEVALEFYLKSLEILKAQENQFYQIDVYVNLSNVFMKRSLIEKASKYLNKALSLAEEVKVSKKSYQIYLKLSEFYEKIGDYKNSIEYYKKYHDAEREVGKEYIERNLNSVIFEFKVEQARKQAEIYKLRNIELKEKSKEIEEKAKQLEIMNQRLFKEIDERTEVQKNLEKANKKLESLSTIDQLTGIPNRRYFDLVFEIEWKRAIRENASISIVMIDIDFFKEFNDRYGHVVGDDCIREIAKALSLLLNRSMDFIARYGGEEFVVVLPNTDKSGAIKVAETMRRRIELLESTKEHPGLLKSITISLGTATVMPALTSKPQELIIAADTALYAAKRAGRNSVETAI